MVPTAAMPGAQHKQLEQGEYHAKLQFLDKGRAIKELVV